MDAELEKKILHDIEESGFPLELHVVKQLREARWLVHQNVRYHDAGDTIAEIDVLATTDADTDASDNSVDLIALDVVCECKRSRKRPWVFFREPFDLMSMFTGAPIRYLTDLQFAESHSLLSGSKHTALADHHYWNLPKSRTFFEACGDGAGSNIWKAACSVWKGLEWWVDTLKSAPHVSPNRPRTRLIHGAVVFDGILVLATHEEEGFKLTEVPHILLRVSKPPDEFGSSTGVDGELAIDIVHASYLPTYAQLCQSDASALGQHVVSLREAGWVVSGTEPVCAGETLGE